MAIRKGDIAKEAITSKIVEIFGNDVVCIQDKKIYINMQEGPEIVQIAISLTMPKTPIGEPIGNGGGIDFSDPATTTPIDISPKDKEAIERLKAHLGII